MAIWVCKEYNSYAFAYLQYLFNCFPPAEILVVASGAEVAQADGQPLPQSNNRNNEAVGTHATIETMRRLVLEVFCGATFFLLRTMSMNQEFEADALSGSLVDPDKGQGGGTEATIDICSE